MTFGQDTNNCAYTLPDVIVYDSNSENDQESIKIFELDKDYDLSKTWLN